MLIFDIETGPRPDDELRQVVEQFDPSRVSIPAGEFDPANVPGTRGIPTEFDSSTVKLGRMNDQAKIADKIAAARTEHARLVAERDQRIEQARVEFERAKADAPRILAEAEAAHWSGVVGKAALSPITGRVLAIGYYNPIGDKVAINGVDEAGDEVKLLLAFWAKYATCRAASRSMLGFNIFGFDLPFLARRSWLLGVDLPTTLFDPSGRYFDRVFVDLMARWKCGNYSDNIKLAGLAKFFGVGDKPDGVSGADFARLWAEDREQAIAYLANDLRMTAACAARMGFV